MTTSKRSRALSLLAATAIKHPDLVKAAVDKFLAAAARREQSQTLAGFVQAYWRVVEPNTFLLWSWHLQAVCDHLQAISEGRLQHLIINIPPGHMKSLLVAVFWPAWEWGPAGMSHLKILSTSFKEDHAARDARRMRDLVKHPDYQEHWGDTVNIYRGGESDYENLAHGWRKARPITSMTGDRGDRLIIDDPHSTEMAESETERFKSTRVLTESLLTRLNHPETSSIVVIMQRLHQDDATGILLKLGLDFTHLCLPMRFEEARRCTTKIGFVDPRTKEGDLLCPQRLGKAKLRELEKGMGAHAVACQHQQNPVPREGNMFKRAWFEPVESYPPTGATVRAWDLAATTASSGRDPDWTVGLKVRLGPGGELYILDMVRKRVDASDVLALIQSVKARDEYNCDIALPEDPAAGGKITCDHLIRALGKGYPYASRGLDKRMRAQPVVIDARLGKVRLVKEPWNQAFLDEVCAFPRGSHDDIVDALSLAHEHLMLRGQYANFYKNVL